MLIGESKKKALCSVYGVVVFGKPIVLLLTAKCKHHSLWHFVILLICSKDIIITKFIFMYISGPGISKSLSWPGYLLAKIYYPLRHFKDIIKLFSVCIFQALASP